MESFNVFSISPRARPASWSITFLLGRDLNFMNEIEYKGLSSAIIEIKRMLASLALKVEADRLAG